MEVMVIVALVDNLNSTQYKECVLEQSENVGDLLNLKLLDACK